MRRFAALRRSGADNLLRQTLRLKPSLTHAGTSRNRVPHGSIASTTLFSISTST
jgi:hypothetical protein